MKVAQAFPIQFAGSLDSWLSVCEKNGCLIREEYSQPLLASSRFPLRPREVFLRVGHHILTWSFPMRWIWELQKLLTISIYFFQYMKCSNSSSLIFKLPIRSIEVAFLLFSWSSYMRVWQPTAARYPGQQGTHQVTQQDTFNTFAETRGLVFF